MGELKRIKPPKTVLTIRDLIYWEYACLIARAAGFERNYGFIVSRFKKLQTGEMEWSSAGRDWMKEHEKAFSCLYCGSTTKLSQDHIIPITRGQVDPRIHELLNSSENCVLACQKCNSSKGDRDILEWFGSERFDEIPKLALSKFLQFTLIQGIRLFTYR